MKFFYILTNTTFIILFWLIIYEKARLNEFNIYMILAMIVIMIMINIFLFVFIFIMDKLFNYLIKKYEERKMKNYSLFEWMGEHTWIDLYNKLSNIKEFNRKDIIGNFGKIKEEITNNFDSKEKLSALKIFLEIRVESPRLTTLTTVTNTMLLSVITTSLISYLNGILSLDTKATFYILTFVVVFSVLIFALSFFSKEIDKYKLLLKLVNECIENESFRNQQDILGNLVEDDII